LYSNQTEGNEAKGKLPSIGSHRAALQVGVNKFSGGVGQQEGSALPKTSEKVGDRA